jgi:uncharacterized protein (DUF4213/DUF364 family)
LTAKKSPGPPKILSAIIQITLVLFSGIIKKIIPIHENSHADVLIITGVTLVNHTLQPILAAARPDAEIAVIGPTASLLPDALFARGVRVVRGNQL